MKREILLALVVVAMLTPLAFAQPKTEPPKAEPPKAVEPKARVAGCEELALAAGEDIKCEDTQALFVFEGRPKSAFYIVVKVNREILEKTTPDVKGLNVKLTFGTTQPVEPYAVAAMKKEVEEGKATYASGEKRRWVTEVYYFAAAPGQREWSVALNGQAAARVLDWYATLIVNAADDASVRIKLPDGTAQIIGGYHSQKFTFPAGTYNLVLEVKGHGKTDVPWTKFDKGDVKYIATVGDIRNGPVLPADTLRKALPKISTAWKMFHKKTGTGGGAYNIASADKPVHVNVDFGQDGNPGGLTRCEVDQISVDYAPEDAPAKRGRKPREGPKVLKYSPIYGGPWKVEPWEHCEFVDITEDARKIVGQVTAGRFVFRSTENVPSQWSNDGLLSKGVLYDKDLGCFLVEAKKQTDLVVLWGVQTKEP